MKKGIREITIPSALAKLRHPINAQKQAKPVRKARLKHKPEFIRGKRSFDGALPTIGEVALL